MADRYFKKSKDKFTVGYSSKIFKYDFTRHNIEDLEERFAECDASGKEIKKVVAKPTKKAKTESKTESKTEDK